MFIRGQKIVRHPLGYAADFCPVCGNARAFAVSQVHMVNHLFHVSTGTPELLGYERACQTCTVPMRVDPNRYADLAKEPLPIKQLVRLTLPNFAEINHDLLTQERAIREDPTALSASERLNLIMLPFMLMSVKVSRWFSQTQLSSGAAFMQREVMPVLVRGLRRIRPTERELQATLDRLVQLDEVIGTKVTLADLKVALKIPPS